MMYTLTNYMNNPFVVNQRDFETDRAIIIPVGGSVSVDKERWDEYTKKSKAIQSLTSDKKIVVSENHPDNVIVHEAELKTQVLELPDNLRGDEVPMNSRNSAKRQTKSIETFEVNSSDLDAPKKGKRSK